jgi:MFS family permease
LSSLSPKPGVTSIEQGTLFTRRFFLLCAFTFATFVSAFLLFPTMPLRILALGGTKSDAGLFLGLLTYASAFSAPIGGALADRIGKRPVLLISSAAILCFVLIYSSTRSLTVILLTALVHGVFWSALLAASAALISDTIPPDRRAEGIGYWGFASIVAVAVAPPLGLLLLRVGWALLCLLSAVLGLGMFAVAFSLSERSAAHAWSLAGFFSGGLIERDVFVLAITLFLYSFGYGGVMSFVPLYAQESGVGFRGVYFVAFTVTVLLTRPYLVRRADRKGAPRILLPLLGLTAAGFGILAISGRLPYLLASGIVFGTGFGSAYPVFASYMLSKIDPARRGAAFGSILLAFDTGIGSGSMLLGIIIENHGYRPAFALASLLALCAIPYFLLVRRTLPRFRDPHAESQ